MADNADERLIVMLEARIRDFEKSMERAEAKGTRTFQQLQRGSKQAGQAMERDVMAGARGINQALASTALQVGGFGKAFLGGLAAGLIAGALQDITGGARAMIGAVADMADEAERVGIMATDFQALSFGMKLAGVDSAEASAAIAKFTDNLGDAARGTGTFGAVLQANGIALRDNAGEIRPTLDLLRDFADVVQRVPDEASRMSLITEAMGRGGKALTLAMADGSAGLNQMMQDSRDAGLVLDQTVIDKARKLDDRFDVLTERAKVFFQTVTVGAADAALAMSDMAGEALAGDALTITMGGLDPGAALGLDIAAQLEANGAAAKDAQSDLAAYGASLNAIRSEAGTLSQSLAATANDLQALGQTKAADAMAALAARIDDTAALFDLGQMNGQTFIGTMGILSDKASTLTGELNGIPNVDFAASISSAGRFAAVLDGLAGAANRAYNAILATLGLASVTPSTPVNPNAPAMGGAGRPEFTPGQTDNRQAVIRARGVIAGKAVTDAAAASHSGGGGGGGGADPQSADVAALVADLQTQRELLDTWYTDSQALLQTATDAQLAALGGRHEALERLETEHQQRMTGIGEAGQYAALDHTSAFFGALATVTQAGGDKAAKAYRVFAATQGETAAVLALLQTWADPSLTFWGKLPAIAAVGAATATLVGSLGGKARSGSSGGSGGAAGGTVAGPVASTGEQTAPALILTLQGLDPAKLFEGQVIIDLVSSIASELGKRGLQMGVNL